MDNNTDFYRISEETMRTRRVYDHIAEKYADKWSNVSFMEERLDQFASYLRRGSIILDAGCGTARDMKYLKSKGIESIGADISERMLKVARENHPTALLVSMDLARLAFKKEQFDGVWACASLIHLPKKVFESALREFNRVLKPDALIFISMKEGNNAGYTEDGRYTVYYKNDELADILRKCGFDVFFYDVNQARKSTFKRKSLDTWINTWARKNIAAQGASIGRI